MLKSYPAPTSNAAIEYAGSIATTIGSHIAAMACENVSRFVFEAASSEERRPSDNGGFRLCSDSGEGNS